MASIYLRARFAVVAFLSQLAFIIIFAFLVDYGWDATPISRRKAEFLSNSIKERRDPGTFQNASLISVEDSQPDVTKTQVPEESFYPMFQDIHVMIFIGFGFLMTFLRKYGYGAVGFNFILAAYVLQWATILRGFFRLSDNNWRIRLDLTTLIGADFTAATILISLGVVLGKLIPIQYVLMVLFETIFVTLNEWIINEFLQVKDIGGTISIHLFGAVFGLVMARVIHKKEWSHENFNDLKFGTHYTDLMSLMGTIFLWMFWPSFNAALATDDGKYRAIYNTYFAISASCLGAYMTSSLITKSKFSLDIIQNSTLAGGVIVGSICDLYLYPWGSLVCGFLAGCISASGFRYLSVILDRWGFHDTCGVNNLHCVPGFLGSIISVIVCACATKEVYSSSYYVNFPTHVPPADSAEYWELRKLDASLKPGLGWTPSVQAGYQLAAIGVTIAIAIAGAVITGLVLLVPFWNNVDMTIVMSDSPYWHGPQKLAKGEEKVLRERIHKELYGSTEDNGTNQFSVQLTYRYESKMDMTEDMYSISAKQCPAE